MAAILEKQRVILRFDDSVFADTTGDVAKSDEVSLSVCSGDLVLIRLARLEQTAGFADACAGIIKPRSGSVRFLGRNWQDLPPDQANALRELWDEYEAKASPESKFANALDRVQPFLHNYFTSGHTWQKHGIEKKQVIARMQPVNDGSHFLWKYVSSLIDDAVKQEFLAQ